jgi:hypothetical protein
MPDFDPSVGVPVIYPRPAAGFRRLVQVIYPYSPYSSSGLLATLLSNDASLAESGNPNYTKYAATPGTGPKQKVIHTAGTAELTWTVGGDVTAASLGLLMSLFKGSARGVNFQSVLVSQGSDGFFFDNSDGTSLPWGQVSLTGGPNAGLQFSIEGKATIPAAPASNVLGSIIVDYPVPTWATGNDRVLSWSLSHNVNLQPHWFNTPGMLPAYYRAGDSEFTLQVTMATALVAYTLIRIGFGSVSLAEMVVTSRNATFGDRNSPVTYQVSSTNSKLLPSSDGSLDGYSEFVNIALAGVPDASYP